MANNYDVWLRKWQQRMLTLDLDAVREKLPFVEVSETSIALPYFGEISTISRIDGTIDGLSLYDQFNIYTLLWYCQPEAALTGEFLPFSQLRSAGPYAPAFQRDTLNPFAAAFDGKMDRLEAALVQLGGRKLPHGDVGYEIEPFPCLPMQVLFWDGDDEFPAQANLLFDKSAPDFIHVESVVTIAEAGISRLNRNS